MQACWNVAKYKWKVHNGKIEIISLIVDIYSQSSVIVIFYV